MDNFIYFYQRIPFNIDSIAFSFGPVRVDWYSLSYIFGFLTVYLLLRYRLKKKEGLIEVRSLKLKTQDRSSNLKVNSKIIGDKFQILNSRSILDLIFYSFFGLLIGARLGYVFFYNFSYFWNNPLAIISPFDPMTHEFIGIYGMSYHGGLMGTLLASWIFTKKNNINFFKLANFVIPAIPAGYFFGRIGNFLNGELYGRMTEKFWGMYFSFDYLRVLRHPSQLYEAFFEGIVIFLILWKLRNNEKIKDKLLGIYISIYAVFRIFLEFFREPDEQIGYLFQFLTLGQILSLIMLIFGTILILYSPKTKKML